MRGGVRAEGCGGWLPAGGRKLVSLQREGVGGRELLNSDADEDDCWTRN